MLELGEHIRGWLNDALLGPMLHTREEEIIIFFEVGVGCTKEENDCVKGEPFRMRLFGESFTRFYCLRSYAKKESVRNSQTAWQCARLTDAAWAEGPISLVFVYVLSDEGCD